MVNKASQTKKERTEARQREGEREASDPEECSEGGKGRRQIR